MTISSKWVLMLMATACLGCGEGKMDTAGAKDDPIARVPAQAWEKLASKRIYFGHQSVGLNIMQGVRDLVADNPSIRLNVLDLKEGMALGSGGVFAHGPVGKNQQPATKLDDFRKNIEGESTQGIDIAFLKFCYVDIVETTDVPALVADYKARMDELKKRHPGTVFVHLTVPLITDRPSIKNAIKKFLGRGGSECAENIRKNEYNGILLKEYGGKESVFDLAKIESTRGDGTRVTCTINGKTFFCLNPVYTDDGGHLNAKGRKVVAAHLLAFLAELAEKN